MRVDIYNNGKLKDVITTYTSLQTSIKYRGIGAFEYVTNHPEAFSKTDLKADIAVIGGQAFFIENRRKEDDVKSRRYTLSGQHVNALMARRVVPFFKVSEGETYEAAAIRLITENFINPIDTARKVSEVRIKTKGLTKTAGTSYTVKAGSCATVLNSFLAHASMGWLVTYNPRERTFVFEVLEGADKSREVVFGQKFNNISELDLQEQTQDLAQVGYLYNDETQELKEYKRGEPPTGLDRRELIEVGSDADAIQDALDGATEVLGADFSVKQSKLYTYGVDYSLGDKVLLVDFDASLEVVRPVLEVQEYWEDSHSIDVVFGEGVPTVFSKLLRTMRR